MARIKKKGLEYFPLDTDFMHHRVVRRIMKREGDRALAVLVTVFSYIYSDEGYFLRLDAQCLDDIAAYFYDLTAEDIERIVLAAVEGGLFDAGLYERERVLTSAHIQQQYVFIKKKSKDKILLPELCLLPEDEEGKGGETDAEKEDKAEKRYVKTDISPEIEPQRKEKQSTAKESKENPPLQSPPADGGTKGRPDGEGDNGCAAKGRKVWTQDDIDRLKPPKDGRPRNFEGLRSNLRLFHVPPDEQYAIICRSDYGAIGHTVWRGFCTLRESGGKIKLPGRYLLSLK